MLFNLILSSNVTRIFWLYMAIIVSVDTVQMLWYQVPYHHQDIQLPKCMIHGWIDETWGSYIILMYVCRCLGVYHSIELSYGVLGELKSKFKHLAIAYYILWKYWADRKSISSQDWYKYNTNGFLTEATDHGQQYYHTGASFTDGRPEQRSMLGWWNSGCVE